MVSDGVFRHCASFRLTPGYLSLSIRRRYDSLDRLLISSPQLGFLR